MSCTSFGKTRWTSSTCGRLVSSSRTRLVPWLKLTLRSSSPWTSITGEFQVLMAAIGPACVPAMSKPTLKISELRARPERDEIAAPREPVCPDPLRVDVRAGLEEVDAAEDVAVLARLRRAGVGRVAERVAVHDPAAVVDRQNDAPAAREVLVEHVQVRVRVVVVKARQHRAPRPAVREDRRAAVRVLRHEQLAVDELAVGGLELHELRLDHVLGRERRRHDRQPRALARAVRRAHRDRRRRRPARVDVRHVVLRPAASAPTATRARRSAPPARRRRTRPRTGAGARCRRCWSCRRSACGRA